jgi:aspartyl-tRNA synthetase
MALQNIINAKSGKKIKLQGFVDSIRNKKSIAFIVLRDITGKIQITIVKEKSPQFNDVIEKITPESVITVTGTIKKNPEVKLNGIELLPSELVLESIAATPLPIDSTSLIDTRLDYR